MASENNGMVPIVDNKLSQIVNSSTFNGTISNHGDNNNNNNNNAMELEDDSDHNNKNINYLIPRFDLLMDSIDNLIKKPSTINLTKKSVQSNWNKTNTKYIKNADFKSNNNKNNIEHENVIGKRNAKVQKRRVSTDKVIEPTNYQRINASATKSQHLLPLKQPNSNTNQSQHLLPSTVLSTIIIRPCTVQLQRLESIEYLQKYLIKPKQNISKVQSNTNLNQSHYSLRSKTILADRLKSMDNLQTSSTKPMQQESIDTIVHIPTSSEFPTETHSMLKRKRNTIVCKICKQIVSGIGKLKQHMAVHKLKSSNKISFKCDKCGKFFETAKILKSHKLRHEGDKKYKCDICLKTYVHKCDLKVHLFTHTTKPNSCHLCVKKFVRKDHLKNHLKTHQKK